MPADQHHNHQGIRVDDISLYVEAADQPTLRRTLRAVLDHLDTLTRIAAASTAFGQSAKDHAHDTHAAAVQAATAPGSSGPDSHALAATATDAYSPTWHSSAVPTTSNTASKASPQPSRAG